MIRIGITKENIEVGDVRSPFNPIQSNKINSDFHFNVEIQSSNFRCFKDKEFKKEGIQIVKKLNNSDIIFGIKEADKDKLIKNKTYFMFSHTIKKQPQNRNLLIQILKKKIKLVDYECLKKRGKRIVAFGKYAGIAGTYNSIMAFGKKFNLFNLNRLSHFKNKNELYSFLENNHISHKIRTLIVGTGRVAKGASEILKCFGFKYVNFNEYKKNSNRYPVYSIIKTSDYIKNISGKKFSKIDYYNNPKDYKSNFLKISKNTDILINASYWDPRYPRLFEKDKIDDTFSIKVIGDISCDIKGSVPLTEFASTIKKPFFDYCLKTKRVKKAFENDNTVTMMTIDNLPSELPRDSSNYFGKILMAYVIPFLNESNNRIIEKATITENGNLKKKYEYLKDYIS